MAVTKIHPIKSTLKKALDYIENPDKTDEKLFVSSYGCSYETADIEFQMLLDQAYQKGNNLAHHLIQAFEPGETTAEQAHEIGRRLADEVLQGKYPYVITTHIDNLYALKTEYKKLDIERERLSAQYSEAKQKLKEYGIVKQNVDSILRTAPGKEHTQER